MKMQKHCLVVVIASLVSSALAVPPPSSSTKGRLAGPQNLRHRAASPAHLRIEWDDVATGETGYRIWRRESGGEWYPAGATGPDVTHFDDGGMKPATNYEHRVAAFDKSGAEESAISASSATLPMTSHLGAEVVIPSGKTYPAGPSSVLLHSGELLLAYQIGNAEKRKNHAGESIWLRASRDGRTGWSDARLLFAGDAQTVFGKSALVRMQNGRLGMAFSRWTCNEKGLIVDRKRQFVASADEGKTWSEPVDIGPFSANNHTLIVGSEGRLLEALSDFSGVAKIYGSDDHGGTWREMGSVAGKRLGEAALAHVGDGQIVFLSRHEWPFYRLSVSSDNGVTWEKTDAVLPLGGGDNPPKLVLLPDGKTLAAVVHSWYPGKKAKDRRQLASLVSRDGGRTWDNFRLIGFAPEGNDGFLQHSLTFVDNVGYLFYSGGSRLDTNDGKDLRLIRLHADFFTSTSPWPYDWQGKQRSESALNPSQGDRK
ncbi:exo-alpha-sialidase [Anatilimnocola sp. NA78]|uniref:sialidase family protein n=1 Tax=Anatilimnocola sp. NA78 TaxID=3415683 RepID=UPI003CE56106